MDKQELCGLLHFVIYWIENKEERIADAICDILAEVGDYIAEDADRRDRIAKAIAVITDDVEAWREED